MSAPAPQSPRAYIFLNGDFEKPTRDWPERPAPGDLVLAADGGGRHAASLGWPVHCLVGDFDSLSPPLLAGFEARGTEIIRHPVDKDEIDFELALMLARRRGHGRIEVLGAVGGRWDMSLANLFLPRAVGRDGGAIRFRHGDWTFLTVTGPAELTLAGRAGDRLSLLPLGEDVPGITLRGCRYPLAGETLKAGFSRGLSNRLTDSEASLTLASGTLLVMHQAVEGGSPEG